MKKLCTLALSLGLLAGTCTSAMAADMQVYYNGVELELQQPAVIQDGRTLLALRDVAEQMNLEISWDNVYRLAEVTFYDKTITFQPDVRKVYLNGEERAIDVGPQIINDRIYLPVRYMFELFEGNVFYKVHDNGTIVVAVDSYDSYINLETQAERLTTVVRKTDIMEDNIVFRNHNNETMEVAVDYGEITIHRYRDTLLDNYTTDTLKSIKIGGNIYDIINMDGKYWAVLEDYKSDRYLGEVAVPSGNLYHEIITPQGIYEFSGGEQVLRLFDLEGDEGFVDKTIFGYTMDIGDKYRESVSYAINDKNAYGFLTDGHFVMVGTDPVKDKGLVVKANETISETLRSGKVFAYGDTFGIIGVDRRENGKAELFTTTFTGEGMRANSYSNISKYYLEENFTNMTIHEMVQDGSKVYVLLQIYDQLYLAAWDLVDNSFTSEKLDRKYQGFVLSNDTYQLFDEDERYYYFYALR